MRKIKVRKNTKTLADSRNIVNYSSKNSAEIVKSSRKISYDMPKMSDYFKSKRPSAIRLAGMEYAKRTDGAKAIIVAIITN